MGEDERGEKERDGMGEDERERVTTGIGSDVARGER